MLNDHIIISPINGPLADLAEATCQARNTATVKCTKPAAFLVEDMVRDGYGSYGESVDTGSYCRGHVIVAVAERL